ncbi:MAG: hypothetical protein JXB62_07085 [Pirellulales bacterium]|nr:hypothetical protein [Pirellulales bacterium]
MQLGKRLRLLPAVAVAWTVAAAWMGPAAAEAGVVILASRIKSPVEFVVAQPGGESGRHRLEPYQQVPIPVEEKLLVAFNARGVARRYTLEANTVHYFLPSGETFDLKQFPLPSQPPARPAPKPAAERKPLLPVYKIPVMLLVDDDEPAVQRLWEKRLRDRLAAASEIFEQHCRVGFEVVAVGTWESDDRVFDFEESLREFEMTVKPAPAKVAIGFTSQYRSVRGRAHLGGTRGPLHSHILIREWSQHISHTERLEVLVHELGHYLGAVHSIEASSVMRPTIGDHRSHARDFRIGFDPLNTLVMYTLGEELRAGRFAGINRLRPEQKALLRSAYTVLSKYVPGDKSAENYMSLLDHRVYVRHKPVEQPRPLVEATRRVVAAIGEASRRNQPPTGPNGAEGGEARLSGDRLSDYYVRAAAAAAAELPDDVAAKAFLLALGVAMDDSVVLRRNPIAGDLCRQIETPQQRRQRLATLGAPTMRGRRDLAQHFVASCALTVLLGPSVTESVGVGKELLDARGRTGFSFADLSADVAGITFATHVLDQKISLASLATSFSVEDYLLEANGLAEGIPWEEFLKHFTSAQDARFHRQRTALHQRILALPGYQNL